MLFTFRRCRETANTDGAMLGLRVSVPKQAVQHVNCFYYLETSGANAELYNANWNCCKAHLWLSVAHKAEFWYCIWHVDLFFPPREMCCIIMFRVRCLHCTKKNSFKQSKLRIWLCEAQPLTIVSAEGNCERLAEIDYLECGRSELRFWWSGFFSVCFSHRISERHFCLFDKITTVLQLSFD